MPAQEQNYFVGELESIENIQSKKLNQDTEKRKIKLIKYERLNKRIEEIYRKKGINEIRFTCSKQARKCLRDLLSIIYSANCFMVYQVPTNTYHETRRFKNKRNAGIIN